MVVYVHIEYSTYQFSEKSKWGGIHYPPPPRSLRYRKKRGPEGVKVESGARSKEFFWGILIPASNTSWAKDNIARICQLQFLPQIRPAGRSAQLFHPSVSPSARDIFYIFYLLTLSALASFRTHISKCSERGVELNFLIFFS